jgi:hypothetical protein
VLLLPAVSLQVVVVLADEERRASEEDILIEPPCDVVNKY